MLLESATLLIAVAIDSILNKNLFPLAEPKKKQISEAQVKKPARARKKSSDGKPQRSPAPRSSAKRKTSIDKELVNAVVEQIKTELPELIETLRHIPQPFYVSEALDAQCLNQISLAQEFLNENHSADLSRVKCLLRKMFPREYHDVIESLKEHQDPTIIYNICGGNNIIAPKAKTAQQLQNISEERKNKSTR